MSTLGGPNIEKEDLILLIDSANTVNIVDEKFRNIVNYNNLLNINGNINIEGLFLLLDNNISITGDILGLGQNISICFLFKTNQLNIIKTDVNGIESSLEILESTDNTQISITLLNNGEKIIQKLYLNAELILTNEITEIKPVSLINKLLINNTKENTTKFSYLMIYNKVLSEFEIEKNFFALLRT
jgi:hypothetical protein